jgi:hypothetical protein
MLQDGIDKFFTGTSWQVPCINIDDDISNKAFI